MAVIRGATVAKVVPESKTVGFIEWEDCPEKVREGRRLQADYLLQHYKIISLSPEIVVKNTEAEEEQDMSEVRNEVYDEEREEIQDESGEENDAQGDEYDESEYEEDPEETESGDDQEEEEPEE